MELSNQSRISRDSTDKLTPEQIYDIVKDYLSSDEFELLQKYDSYYEGSNTFIADKVSAKESRDKTPNNKVSTAYYSTIVDTMSGFLFSNVQYVPKSASDDTYAKELNNILTANHNEVKEMKTGTFSLSYNKGVELVYTVGNGALAPEIKYTTLDPRQCILIYDNKIEPDVFCLIWVRVAGVYDNRTEYKVDLIYKDSWEYYLTDKEKLLVREESRELFFKECPVVVYNTNNMSIYSSFHKIISYIDVLDFLISGNANEIESLTDAILVLSEVLQEEDLKHLNELKTLQNISKDDRAEYLTKQTDPEFRRYASELLIKEIHKHSHIVDYFSSETGMSGELSGIALRIKLFDMESFSNKIEKVYKLGTEKRIRLITSLMSINGGSEGEIEIIFNRTIPSEFIEMSAALNSITFISDETKLEKLGMDAEKEAERLAKQKEENMKNMPPALSNTNVAVPGEEVVKDDTEVIETE